MNAHDHDAPRSGTGPFLATLLGGQAILEAGSAEQKKQWLPRLADGKAKAALAWTEPSARWDAAGVATTAKPTADGWLLSGTKSYVQDAAGRRLYRPSRRRATRTCTRTCAN